jgi:hypothetical protein
MLLMKAIEQTKILELYENDRVGRDIGIEAAARTFCKSMSALT